MKTTSRLLALLLTLTMLFPVNAAALSAGPATLAAQSDRVITGSITATLRVDYAQRLSELSAGMCGWSSLRATPPWASSTWPSPGSSL